jgi:PAS domain S-box-containing protein
MFIVAMCFVVFFSVAQSDPPQQTVNLIKHVLIINSYHKGYPWTDSTIAGIESVLKGGKDNVELHVEFMDTKRGDDKNLFYHLFQHYLSKFESVRLNLVIAADNDAVNFVSRYREALFPNTPVVFCGVNALSEVLQKKIPSVTGVVEHYDINATLEVALNLHPATKEIIAVNNATPIGAVKKRLFREAMALVGKNLKSTIIDDPTLADFEKLIKEKSKNCVVFLLGSFKEKSGVAVPVEVSTPIIAKHDVPLYAGIEHYLGYGIIGGKLISGYQQGALAAQMGLKILQGESVEKIPIERKGTNLFMFDYNQMVRFGISREALPEGSVVINAPKANHKQKDTQDNTRDKEKKNELVWLSIAASVCLGIIVLLLVLLIRSRRRDGESRARQLVDLEKRVEARTEELMRANAELLTKINETKNAEVCLAESQLKYLTLFQKAPNPVFIIDENARFSDCNEKMIEFLECTLDELHVMDVREIVPGDVLAQLLESPEQSAHITSFEAQYVAHGKTKTLLINLAPVILFEERFVYGTGQEITELKKAQDLRKKKEEFLKRIIDTMQAAVMISGRDGTVEYVSEGFSRIVGFTQDDIPTMEAWLQKAYPDKAQRDSALAAWSHALAVRGSEVEDIQRIESTVMTKDGTFTEKELRFIPDHDKVATVIHSVKEKTPEAITPVSRSQDSIETLAAGIAHDFNNLLLVILGNISLAKTGLTQEEKVFERLSEAEQASLMTKDLIQQLITFAKGGELSKRATVITPLVMEVTRSTLINSNIKGKYVMSDDLFPVEIDEGQIRQVIHTILRNAKEAMPQGGIVTITLENVRITGEDFLPLKDGNYVRISFQDEGLGIKKEHLERIFDPYFTTKDVGSQKGVGLGLAIAYSIMKKHGGHIAVASSMGGGTIFHIYLPACGKEMGIGREAEGTFVEPTKRKGRILVMDDAKAVRDVTGAMLSHIGYDVEFARDGREAVALYREAKQSEGSFDAVILDLTVQGGMGGKEAIQLLLTTDPHVKAIVSSGYSGDQIMSEYYDYGFKAAILKPYKMEELEEVLERIIRVPV